VKLNWTDGNQVDLLENGEAFYPAVFAAIDAARDEVLIETFILFEDKVGVALADRLVAAAQRGVRVHLTIDDWGSPDLSAAYVERLTRAGVALHVFCPAPRLFGWRTNVMRRLHRKLVAVDDRIAFVGGINYSADHLGDYGPEAKTDYAARLEGPIAVEIARFLRNVLAPVRRARWWHRVDGRWRDDLGPARADAAGARVCLVTRDNRDHATDIERQYRVAIRAAQRDIVIANAYFFPGYLLLRSIARAARRGVRVRLLVQGQPDMKIVTFAARLLYAYLARSGVEIHEYCERPFHGKVAVVDGLWSTIGSSNLDPLSLTMNLEANVIVLDERFNRALRRSLERLMSTQCRTVTPVPAERRGPVTTLVTALVLAVARRFPDWVGLLPAPRPPHLGVRTGAPRDAVDSHRAG
jgi:cardiolipin synthase